jgi:hypothetical protein
LLASKAQQLPGQDGTAVRGLSDLLDVLAAAVIRGDVAQQQIAEATDGGQQVVEVMRHSPGQSSRGVHPLHLTQLFLTLMERRAGAGALADVGGEDQPGSAAVQLHLVGDQLHLDD